LSTTGVSTLLVDARPVDHPTARRRGIGRWVTGLLAGLVEIDAPVLALCGGDTEADELAGAIPGLTLGRWSPGAVRDHAQPGTWYLATQLMLHPIPLDPIPRVVTEARLPVAAVMYDVIPYRHPDRYLAEPNARRQAELRAPLARTVDSLLAISDFAAVTAAEELRFPVGRIGMIGAGVEAKFAPPNRDPRPASGRVLPPTVGEYVVAVTGDDERKNTVGLIRAWAEVERALAGRFHLVIANAASDASLRRWRAVADEEGIADRVVFTGGLDDDELVAVLQGASLSVMPSFEEGFGLPVLEAAACGVPAICSDCSSLPEVLDEPAACFDPHRPDAIAAAVVRALTDDDHRSILLAAGRRATQRWTWANVASATLETLAAHGPRWPQRLARPAHRVALVGPPGTVSGGPWVDPVVAALQDRGTETTVFVDGSGTGEPTGIAPRRWPARALGRYLKPWDFDHIVARLVEPSHHVATATTARRIPCHLWIDDAALLAVEYGADVAALDIARSLIVSADDVVDRLHRLRGGPVPTLVLTGSAAPDATADAIAEWLTDVDDLEPAHIRHR
jgi:glycosyltransferase involved in cell wall biosynthesis